MGSIPWYYSGPLPSLAEGSGLAGQRGTGYGNCGHQPGRNNRRKTSSSIPGTTTTISCAFADNRIVEAVRGRPEAVRSVDALPMHKEAAGHHEILERGR